MNKIVITGALGHIGSALLQRAPVLFPDADLIIIDDLSTQRYCSLFNLPQDLSYNFVESKIQNINLEPLIENAEAVIHLGATTDAAGTAHNPDLIFQNNLPATEHLIKACLKTGTPLIFPSSTSVYGVQDGLVDESCQNLLPQSPYADCKIQEEEMIRGYNKKGLRSCIARLGTIFGISPGMRFHTAVNKFCWQAAMSKPITVWSTAMDQKRPYLGVDDSCRFFSFVINNKLFNNDLYNVVTQNYTVRNVIDTIKQYVPELKIEMVDSPIMNQLSYEVSAEKIRGEGFVNKDNIEKSISETIGLLKANAAVLMKRDSA